MQDQPSDVGPSHSEDFLLAEFAQLSQSFWHSEELGDRRVNFFITLTTAVLAASAAIATKEEIWRSNVHVNPVMLWTIFFAPIAVLLFGLFTLARLIKRNKDTDDYKRALNRVRGYFKEKDPAIQHHLAFDPDKPVPLREIKVLSFGTGGLVQTVALMNGLVAAALAALLIIWLLGLIDFAPAWGARLVIYLASSAVVFLVAWTLQVRWVAQEYGGKKKKAGLQHAR